MSLLQARYEILMGRRDIGPVERMIIARLPLSVFLAQAHIESGAQ